MDKKSKITQEELKEILDYNPNTGIFIWRNSKSGVTNNFMAGSFNDRYISICINQVTYQAHVLAWLYIFGEYPKEQLDHINVNARDNRISNLRECSKKQNSYNRKTFKNNTSRYKGVSINGKKWKATISRDRNPIHLGTFDSKEDAAMAYNKKAQELFGEFAYINKL